MRVLFYVEPVSFKLDHRFISPVLNVIRCIINANLRNDVEFGILGSAASLEEYDEWLKYGGVQVYRKCISERDILREFDFRLNDYAEYLFTASRDCNIIDLTIRDVESQFGPDVIICFAQNAVMESLSRTKLVLFSERGPLRRWNGRDNFYFDPVGHQLHSILVRRSAEIKSFDVPETDALELIDRFSRIHAEMTARIDPDEAIFTWLERVRYGRSIALIANQPHDSLLVIGATGGIRLEEYMMRTIATLPDDWLVFGTYHPDMGDCSKLDERLASQFPNYVALPAELRHFGSDPFVEAVDAVITIGSKAAFPAALLGKKVIASPSTMLAGFSAASVGDIANARPLTPVEAGRVLAFLASRYSMPHELLFHPNGHWLEMIERMLCSRDAETYMLNSADWELPSFDRMYGLQA